LLVEKSLNEFAKEAIQKSIESTLAC